MSYEEALKYGIIEPYLLDLLYKRLDEIKIYNKKVNVIENLKQPIVSSIIDRERSFKEMEMDIEIKGDIDKKRNIKGFEDIYNKMIPLFNNHKIIGVKLLDYLDFCKVAKLMSKKKKKILHLKV